MSHDTQSYDTHFWPENQNCVGCMHAFWRRGENHCQESMCSLGQPDPAHCRLREDDDSELFIPIVSTVVHDEERETDE